MDIQKSLKSCLLLPAIAGFVAGCAVAYFFWSRDMAPSSASTSHPDGLSKQTRAPVASARNVDRVPETGVREPALRGTGARRVLNDIKRRNVASVNVRFFASNDGNFSRQFIDFFELSADEAAGLSDLIKATKAELWDAAKAQAQVSQTQTGGVVIKIPPVAAGPDIYDKVMDGVHAILGDERYSEMMLYNGGQFGGQFESLFNQFGGENRTVTIEKSSGDRYSVNIDTETRPGAKASENATLSRDEISKWKPGLEDFIPAK